MAPAEFAAQVPGAQPSFLGRRETIAYTYDEMGCVSSVTGGTSYDMFASVIYDRVGRVKEVTRGFSTDAVTEAGPVAMGAALRGAITRPAQPTYYVLTHN